MDNIQQEKPLVIDLGIARNGQLNESFLQMFGSAIETILGRMFGNNNTPISIRGTRDEIKAFADVMNKEKKYLTLFQKHGLDDPMIQKDKYELQKAINKFEKETGLIYPLK